MFTNAFSVKICGVEPVMEGEVLAPELTSNNAAKGHQGPTTSHPPWSPNRTTEKSAPPIQDLPLQKAATRKSCRPSPGPPPCWVQRPRQLEAPPSSEAAVYSPCWWAGPSSKPVQSNTSAASHMWPLSARNVVLMDVRCTHETHTRSGRLDSKTNVEHLNNFVFWLHIEMMVFWIQQIKLNI